MGFFYGVAVVCSSSANFLLGVMKAFRGFMIRIPRLGYKTIAFARSASNLLFDLLTQHALCHCGEQQSPLWIYRWEIITVESVACNHP